MKRILLLILLCFIIFISILPVSFSLTEPIIEGDRIYINDSNVYISVYPHTIYDSGFIYVNLTSKIYSGYVDVILGFDRQLIQPKSLELWNKVINNTGTWISITNKFDLNRFSFNYLNMTTWFHLNVSINKNVNYLTRIYIEIIPSLGNFTAKYVLGFKPHSETIQESIQNNHLYVIDPWWDNNWNFRQSFVVSQTNYAGTNYNIQLKVYYGIGSSSGTIVYLNAHSQTDFDDIRFVSVDNTIVYDSWLEYKENSNFALIWFEVQPNLSSQSVTVYIYYGNTGVSNVWNGVNTFLWFDDATTDKSSLYTIEQGGFSYSVLNQWYTPTSDSAPNNWFPTSMINIQNVSVSELFNLETTTNYNKQPSTYSRWDSTNNNGYDFTYVYVYPSSSWRMRLYKITNFVRFGLNTTGLPQYQASSNTWYRTNSYTFGSILKGELTTLSNIVLSTVTYTDSSYTSAGKVMFGTGYEQTYIRLKMFYFRKYVYPEPLVGSWTNEVGNLVYLRFYYNIGGEITIHNWNTSQLYEPLNNTLISVVNMSLIKLVGVPQNSSYVFLSFNWTNGYSFVNPYNYSVLSNMTLWLYFNHTEMIQESVNEELIRLETLALAFVIFPFIEVIIIYALKKGRKNL